MAVSNVSILTSTKKALGIEESYEHFDPEIIMHINSVFSTLQQLGVGPDEGYAIEDKTAQWITYFGAADPKLNSVKSYVYLKVKLLFDPPATSFALAAFEKQTQEYEWRFTINHDSNTVAEQNATPTP